MSDNDAQEAPTTSQRGVTTKQRYLIVMFGFLLMIVGVLTIQLDPIIGIGIGLIGLFFFTVSGWLPPAPTKPTSPEKET